MNRSIKICIAAVVLIVAGTLIAFGAFAFSGFSFRDAVPTPAVQTVSLSESFDDISVQSTAYGVRIVPSVDGVCRVDGPDGERLSFSAVIENGQLSVMLTDDRHWYERISPFADDFPITLYLTENAFRQLEITAASGPVSVDPAFSFEGADVRTVSGSICFEAAVASELSLVSTSGGITVNHSAPQTLSAQSTSGRITLNHVGGQTAVKAKSTSGNVHLSDDVCGSIIAESTSGSIYLNGCDADSLRFRSTSGNILGSLLTGKSFRAESISGSVSVPGSVPGGPCEINTVSGSILITVEQ